jgi:SAM-dependent methyltransferase
MLTKYEGGQGKGYMRNVGNLVAARESWLKKENSNLDYLLSSRYSWMNGFIPKYSQVLEIGSGFGASEGYIRDDIQLQISDNNSNSWLKIKNLDAAKIADYKKDNFQIVIANNVIHHLAFPKKFILDTFSILPKNGKIIIQEINTSLLCRFVLRILRHEPFNENVDVTDVLNPMSNPNDNWDANCSVPNLLFSDFERFEEHFPGLEISHFKYTETLLLLLSGGVTAKIWYPKIPRKILRLIENLDNCLCKISPRFFAFQMQVVIERKD